MTTPAGYVLYKGPSLLNGAPIVVIATLGSDNAKTGNMVQTWILPDNGIMPHVNVKSGADASVCGDCKHRPTLRGACYVRTFQGPRSVYAAYLRGRYIADDGYRAQTAVYNRALRIGSYGDPAAVPVEVWMRLIRNAASHTGYTHQWRRSPQLRGIVMASCDTPQEREDARAAGWRTFTVRLESDVLAPRESACPASDEAGRKTNCAACGACNGAGSGRKGGIAIIAHGGTAKRYREFRMALAAA